MAIGDDAIAAGMDVVLGSVAANTIDTEITKTRDYIAQKTSAVLPVAKGGTGSTTAPGARTALGLGSAAVEDSAEFVAAVTNAVGLEWGSGRLKMRVDGTDVGNIANTGDIPDITGKVNKSGDTMTGDLFIPGSSAAVSGWTVCYINGDGRVSRGSSSERYKEDITPADPLGLGDIFPDLAEYTMVGGDGKRTLGHVAETLIGTPSERFVVYINDQVESIDFIQLLLAQNAQLDARLKAGGL